jgi:hypothetical protein
LERGKRIELSASAWKAEVLPLYEPRINILMHIYDAITNSGLHIHLSMMEDESFYIMVHDLADFTMTMKFFSSVEPALEFIRSL